MKKLRIIVIVLLGILLVGGISAYATYTYLAKDVEYTKANGTKVIRKVDYMISDPSELSFHFFISCMIQTVFSDM